MWNWPEDSPFLEFEHHIKLLIDAKLSMVVFKTGVYEDLVFRAITNAVDSYQLSEIRIDALLYPNVRSLTRHLSSILSCPPTPEAIADALPQSRFIFTLLNAHTYFDTDSSFIQWLLSLPHPLIAICAHPPPASCLAPVLPSPVLSLAQVASHLPLVPRARELAALLPGMLPLSALTRLGSAPPAPRPPAQLIDAALTGRDLDQPTEAQPRAWGREEACLAVSAGLHARFPHQRLLGTRSSAAPAPFTVEQVYTIANSIFGDLILPMHVLRRRWLRLAESGAVASSGTKKWTCSLSDAECEDAANKAGVSWAELKGNFA